jgi:hypothetical protein
LSTEQILHPEKYLAGEVPLEVTLADTASVLGANWRQVDEETLGEFYVRLLFREHLSRTEYNTAATGWGGDRYRTFVREDGEVAMVTVLLWDTATDAEEFSATYALYGDTRTGVARIGDCWVTPSETLCERTFNGMSVISTAPDADTALALLDSQA